MYSQRTSICATSPFVLLLYHDLEDLSRGFFNFLFLLRWLLTAFPLDNYSIAQTAQKVKYFFESYFFNMAPGRQFTALKQWIVKTFLVEMTRLELAYPQRCPMAEALLTHHFGRCRGCVLTTHFHLCYIPFCTFIISRFRRSVKRFFQLFISSSLVTNCFPSWQL